MNRYNYILAGNYLMLNDLYAEKKALEKENRELHASLNAHKQALARLKKFRKDVDIAPRIL